MELSTNEGMLLTDNSSSIDPFFSAPTLNLTPIISKFNPVQNLFNKLKQKMDASSTEAGSSKVSKLPIKPNKLTQDNGTITQVCKINARKLPTIASVKKSKQILSKKASIHERPMMPSPITVSDTDSSKKDDDDVTLITDESNSSSTQEAVNVNENTICIDDVILVNNDSKAVKRTSPRNRPGNTVENVEEQTNDFQKSTKAQNRSLKSSEVLHVKDKSKMTNKPNDVIIITDESSKDNTLTNSDNIGITISEMPNPDNEQNEVIIIDEIRELRVSPRLKRIEELREKHKVKPKSVSEGIEDQNNINVVAEVVAEEAISNNPSSMLRNKSSDISKTQELNISIDNELQSQTKNATSPKLLKVIDKNDVPIVNKRQSPDMSNEEVILIANKKVGVKPKQRKNRLQSPLLPPELLTPMLLRSELAQKKSTTTTQEKSGATNLRRSRSNIELNPNAKTKINPSTRLLRSELYQKTTQSRSEASLVAVQNIENPEEKPPEKQTETNTNIMKSKTISRKETKISEYVIVVNDDPVIENGKSAPIRLLRSDLVAKKSPQTTNDNNNTRNSEESSSSNKTKHDVDFVLIKDEQKSNELSPRVLRSEVKQKSPQNSLLPHEQDTAQIIIIDNINDDNGREFIKSSLDGCAIGTLEKKKYESQNTTSNKLKNKKSHIETDEVIIIKDSNSKDNTVISKTETNQQRKTSKQNDMFSDDILEIIEDAPNEKSPRVLRSEVIQHNDKPTEKIDLDEIIVVSDKQKKQKEKPSGRLLRSELAQQKAKTSQTQAELEKVVVLIHDEPKIKQSYLSVIEVQQEKSDTEVFVIKTDDKNGEKVYTENSAQSYSSDKAIKKEMDDLILEETRIVKHTTSPRLLRSEIISPKSSTPTTSPVFHIDASPKEPCQNTDIVEEEQTDWNKSPIQNQQNQIFNSTRQESTNTLNISSHSSTDFTNHSELSFRKTKEKPPIRKRSLLMDLRAKQKSKMLLRSEITETSNVSIENQSQKQKHSQNENNSITEVNPLYAHSIYEHENLKTDEVKVSKCKNMIDDLKEKNTMEEQDISIHNCEPQKNLLAHLEMKSQSVNTEETSGNDAVTGVITTKPKRSRSEKISQESEQHQKVVTLDDNNIRTIETTENASKEILSIPTTKAIKMKAEECEEDIKFIEEITCNNTLALSPRGKDTKENKTPEKSDNEITKISPQSNVTISSSTKNSKRGQSKTKQKDLSVEETGDTQESSSQINKSKQSCEEVKQKTKIMSDNLQNVPSEEASKEIIKNKSQVQKQDNTSLPDKGEKLDVNKKSPKQRCSPNKKKLDATKTTDEIVSSKMLTESKGSNKCVASKRKSFKSNKVVVEKKAIFANNSSTLCTDKNISLRTTRTSKGKRVTVATKLASGKKKKMFKLREQVNRLIKKTLREAGIKHSKIPSSKTKKAGPNANKQKSSKTNVNVEDSVVAVKTEVATVHEDKTLSAVNTRLVEKTRKKNLKATKSETENIILEDSMPARKPHSQLEVVQAVSQKAQQKINHVPKVDDNKSRRVINAKPLAKKRKTSPSKKGTRIDFQLLKSDGHIEVIKEACSKVQTVLIVDDDKTSESINTKTSGKRKASPSKKNSKAPKNSSQTLKTEDPEIAMIEEIAPIIGKELDDGVVTVDNNLETNKRKRRVSPYKKSKKAPKNEIKNATPIQKPDVHILVEENCSQTQKNVEDAALILDENKTSKTTNLKQVKKRGRPRSKRGLNSPKAVAAKLIHKPPSNAIIDEVSTNIQKEAKEAVLTLKDNKTLETSNKKQIGKAKRALPSKTQTKLSKSLQENPVSTSSVIQDDPTVEVIDNRVDNVLSKTVSPKQGRKPLSVKRKSPKDSKQNKTRETTVAGNSVQIQKPSDTIVEVIEEVVSKATIEDFPQQEQKSTKRFSPKSNKQVEHAEQYSTSGNGSRLITEPDKKADITIFDFDETEPEVVPLRPANTPKKNRLNQPTFEEQRTITLSPKRLKKDETNYLKTKAQAKANLFSEILPETNQLGNSDSVRQAPSTNTVNIEISDSTSKSSTPSKPNMSPPKSTSPLKQATITDMFNKVLVKKEKANAVEAVFGPPKDKSKEIASQNKPNEIATTDMPPPKTERKLLPVAREEGEENEYYDDDDDSDCESRMEWIPEEYAEYKFKYSAKKMMSYKPIHKCKICLLILPSYYKLTKHKQEHAKKENPYSCTQCEQAFSSVEDLTAHLRLHKGKHPYTCNKCVTQVSCQKKALDAHTPIHVLKKVKQPNKRFRCDVCAKEFSKLCDVERHTRVHTGEKPCVCNICNKRFQQSHNLSKHLLTHLHVKPFQCEICNKQFGRNDVLNRHLMIHSG